MYNNGNTSKNVTGASIVDGTIANADVDASAAIATSKLSGALTSVSSHGLATSATTDTTNASNIGSGTLNQARLPSDIANSNIDASAAIVTSKLSGAVTSITSHGLATSATTDTTDASNISSGTLPAARIAADGLSGDKIDGGTISNFTSTGIDDNATSTAITIDASGNVVVGSFDGSGASEGVQTTLNGTVSTSRSSTSTRAAFAFYNPNGMVGWVYTSGSTTTYATSSDYRLKENVVPMTGSIDRLKALKPSRFNFIADADTTVDGFLAHEAQKVVPECASGEKDGEEMQGIDQSKIVPLLVGALQEAITRIEQLENNQ